MRIKFRRFSLLLSIMVVVGLLSTKASAKGPKPCVAILEAEVVGKVSAEDRKAMAGWLDTLLTEGLAKRKDFVTVDRQVLNRVLAEKKINPKNIAASLKPFFAVGVLICPTIRKDKQGKIIVSVEAVLAQTGQLLGRLHEQGVWKNGRWAKSPKVVENMGRFRDDIHRNLKRNTSLPLIEISGKLTSKITRLQWMIDDLGDAASARVALAPNAIPLVPRHPLNTKEERLLRVMGLSVARSGDAAAGLCPAPDVRLLMELSETVKTGVSFAKTPIRLKLSLRRAKAPAITTEIKSEAGKWEACQKKAMAWIDTHVRALSNGGPATTKPDDEARAKRMALEELAAVERWAGGRDWHHRELDTSIRLLIIRKALRAAHLDPTNEKAAYLVAIYVDVLYKGTGFNNRPLVCNDRAILECRRYLNRFGRKVAAHHREVLHRVGIWAITALLQLRRGTPMRSDDILGKPDTRQYFYGSVYARSSAEYGYLGMIDKRYANSNCFDIFGFLLIKDVIPNCPADMLDEEHAYWKNWWKTKVEKIIHRKGYTYSQRHSPAPWCLVEAAFQARKKNPKAVQAAFQQMADKHPKSYTRLWGGDQYNNYRVPVYLRAAGDSQWRTWQPIFRKANPIKINLGAMTGFLCRLWSGSPRSWVFSKLPVIQATEMVVPQRVRRTGRKEGSSIADVDGLLLAGNDVWLVTPATWGLSSRERNRLFTASLTSVKGGKALLNPVEVHWPKYDIPGKPTMTCSRVTNFGGKTTVWIGTRAHGLARFRKVSGKWTGRWYTTRDGMSTNGVSRIATCRSGGKKILLLIGQTTSRMFKAKTYNYSGPKTTVWTLNPNTGDVKLLFDGSRGNVCCCSPAGKLASGRKVLLELLGDDVYGNVDIKDVTIINGNYYYSGSEGTVPVTRDSGKPGTIRVWFPHWDAKVNSLDELSLDTLKPMRGTSPGRGDRRLSVFPVRMPGINGVFGMIYWRSGGYATMSNRWPGGYMRMATGRKDVLWLTINWGKTSAHGMGHLVGYRPAPRGSKDWAEKDRWFGPFRLPAHSTANRMVAYGNNGLLLSTNRGVYLVDCAKAIAQAERSGRVCSTAEWRKQYEKRLAKAGWQSLVPKLIMDKRWDEALKLLDDRQKKLGTVTKASPRKSRDEWMRLMLWRAHVNAKKPSQIAKAIKGYKQVADSGFGGHPAEVFAKINQILLLHKAKRWREMLNLCEKVITKFPQTKYRRKSSGLNWYINDAKKKLRKAG